METKRLQPPVTGRYIKGSAGAADGAPARLQFSVSGLKDTRPYRQTVLVEFDNADGIRELIEALEKTASLLEKK